MTKQITYRQAEDLLHMRPGTVKHAVLRGALTRCAYPEHTALLLQEQVKLFVGKRQVAVRSLSVIDRERWVELQTMAQSPDLKNLLIEDHAQEESIEARLQAQAEDMKAQMQAQLQLQAFAHAQFQAKVNRVQETLQTMYRLLSEATTLDTSTQARVQQEMVHL